eukprot:TRINITY_DN3567_c0_g1_i1.p1 TRINITY_DN3567_c0_g1~~TRINITY_DN3567_c0_g1_i1.p1  ORF type:complete len:304 (+),score=45.60 TRINITY_DN3567_c0_g1_i1:54-914(+)
MSVTASQAEISFWERKGGLLVGTGAHIFSKLLAAPIIRIASLMQLSSELVILGHEEAPLTFLGAASRIYSRDGPLGFFYGSAAIIGRIVVQEFLSYYYTGPIAKSVWASVPSSYPSTSLYGNRSAINWFFTSTIAWYIPKLISLAVVYPLDFIATRHMAGVGPAISELVSENGFMVLYSGFVYAAIARLFLDLLKGYLTTLSETKNEERFSTVSKFIMLGGMLSFHMGISLSSSMRIRAGSPDQFDTLSQCFRIVTDTAHGGIVNLLSGSFVWLLGVAAEGVGGGF